jgi:alanine racemase
MREFRGEISKVATAPTRATIHLSAIRANFAEARRAAGGLEPIAVVKADAYGHGAIRVAQSLLEAGCQVFAVANVAEAASLRNAGIREKILVLGGVFDAAEASEAAGLELIPVVHHAGQLELLIAATRRRSEPLTVHLEVDTGMSRMGAAPDQAILLLESIAREPSLTLGGTYTHLARADEVDLAPSLTQLSAFAALLDEARSRGIDPGMIHVSNSAGLLAGAPLRDALPEQAAVRPGVMLYGVTPAPHLKTNLLAAMTLRTRVVQLRHLAAGEAVGYSAEFRARSATRIATLPIGYADGLPIAASGRGFVRIGGCRLPIVGRVSMDYTTVEIDDAPIEIGDEVIVFGGAGESLLPVEEAAAAAKTIAYELLVRVGGRVEREFEA